MVTLVLQILSVRSNVWKIRVRYNEVCLYIYVIFVCMHADISICMYM